MLLAGKTGISKLLDREAKIKKGFKLPVRFAVHTVGPV